MIVFICQVVYMIFFNQTRVGLLVNRHVTEKIKYDADTAKLTVEGCYVNSAQEQNRIFDADRIEGRCEDRRDEAIH